MALAYQTEHELVVDYLNNLNLEDYIGSYDPRDVIVLADSGYDDKKIENAIANKHWNFIIALGKTRSVKSETLYLTTPTSRQWCHIATFFRNHRRLKWTTIRVHDEWGETQANGVSHPTHDGLSALCGEGPIGVLRTQKTTGWSPQVFRL